MVSKQAYRVAGTFKAGRWTVQKFAIEVAAETESAAIELVYSRLGSRHKVKRRFIKITEIQSMEKDKITNPAVKALCADSL